MRIGKIKIEYYKKKYPDSFGRNVDLRNACFDRFSQEYFHLSPYCKNREELKAMANNYSAFVVGSDQLWRTDSVEHGYYTLEWVPDNICKIAYSTSLGIKKVPWFQRKKNRWFMKRFNYMALREKSACDLVYKLIGREIQVVLDPTLLFTGEQWMHIQQEKPLTNGKYIFCYLLGNNPQQRLFISEVQKRTGLKIVALQHLDEYIPSDEGFANETPYDVGPAEFLNYVRNSEYIFTDSFHCSAFSILYKKNFFVFSRFSENAMQNTNTRIDNLLSLTNLSQRKIDTKKNIDNLLSMPLDYVDVDERLEILRKSSLAYLEQALKGIEL